MSTNTEDKLFASLIYRYFPYWPLFILLLVVSLVGAWGYLNIYATPTYEVSASLLIKDEKKGVVDSKMTESIDAFTSNKIVENEINIIHSHALLKKVVDKLQLYAPVYEEGKVKSISAYASSPIKIKLKRPDKAQEQAKIYFTFDEVQNRVTIDNKAYKLNKWVKTPYGEMRFSKNKNKIEASKEPLYFSIIQPQKITNQLLESISIEASSKLSTVIDLRLRDFVPQRGEDILNTLIKTYTQVAISEREKVAANTLDFVENRINLVERELDSLEYQVVNYKSTNGAVDLSEQSKLFLRNVGDNDRKISEINTQLAVLDKVEKYIISKNNTTGIVPSTMGINDPILSQLLHKLYDSEIKYQQLRKTTAENNPILVSITDEIKSIRPSILENIKNQRTNLIASRSNLASTSNGYNSVLQNIPQKERELLEISRQQMIKNDAYSFLLKKREETVLSYAPSAGDVRIVDMAEASVLPVTPKPLYIYLVAIMVACALGFVMIVGKELLNSKVLFRSEIEGYSSAPIVAELSYVKRSKDGLFKEPTEASVIEQFRQLRTTMGLYGRTFTKKKIMVTSSIPGEGKSFISTNLAFSLSLSGKKVVLLDFDFRNPNISSQFNLYKENGITDYLKNELNNEKIIRNTAYNNLFIVPAGKDVGDHTEILLNGSLLDGFFEYLEKEFDYIIIDTPPLELVSDAYLLTEYCDITLLVMRHAYTPKNIVQRLTINNKLNSLKNVAIVFNGIKARGFVKGQYGYGYGYGYDNKYGDKTYRARNIAAKA
ncbi:GumC family protein [Pontibacter silvestris]|uniref:non-specific protein-tyrosine kinase n=1 Tax=Pontibacter silvestris TaxID=2305183 RepID=A0ABW4WZB8_9BACT|nr:tyrosine-protein kinase [Pontibacter silvestris]MCC9138538.1 polysaccharide biosynthesis tyrosine autokinase [Pontibacter silvestris]